MARGYPGVISAILSLPFIIGGGYLYWGSKFGYTFVVPILGLPGGLAPSLFVIPHSNLRIIGISMLVFGIFILLIGLYVKFATLSTPRIQDEEEILETRHPSQRVAISKVGASIPFLIAGIYFLLLTIIPYVYPTSIFIIGLYFFSSGLKTYWANSLTRYYVTDQRVIKDYRFLSLRRQEIPLEKIRGVEERRSITEMIVGLGNIQIASGGGGGSVRIALRNMRDSAGFAEIIRDLM